MSTLDQDEANKLITQTKEIHEGIVQVTMAWPNLESAMAMLLASILNDEDGSVASAIYFSPGSSDVRFKLVDSAFRELCGKSKLEPDSFRMLIAPWATVLGQLVGFKTVRNQVAHGQVSTVARYNKNHVRLTVPFFHFAPLMESVRRRQLPGLSGNDIKQSADKMWKLSNSIHLFPPIAKAIHAKDEAAMQRAFLATAASLTKEDRQTNTQTIREPQQRPRPFDGEE